MSQHFIIDDSYFRSADGELGSVVRISSLRFDDEDFEPLVETAAGGAGGGGARVTDAAQDVLARYRAMEEKAAGAVAAEIDDFTALLKDPAKDA